MLFKLIILLIFCVLERNPADANYTLCDSLSEKCILREACIIASNMGYLKRCASRSVCCPVPKRPKADTLSSIACLNYSTDTTFCPSQLYISNANISNRNELQYMAHVGQKDGTEKTWHCGGTLIHRRFVLTAAHCVNLVRDVGTQEKELVVRLGGHNITDGRVYDVAKKIPHHGYHGRDTYYRNDIALLKLTQAVDFNDQVKPACLPTSSGEEHEIMTVSGWGLYSQTATGDTAPELRKADLKLFNISECPDMQREMHICAGGDNIASDSCRGDSGGPLAKWHQEWGSCLGQVFGIVSEGSLCYSLSPRTKYTKVFHYLQWIEDTVWPDSR